VHCLCTLAFSCCGDAEIFRKNIQAKNCQQFLAMKLFLVYLTALNCLISLAKNMDAKIVMAVFNQAHYTKNCLDSLRNAGVKDSQIIVVDNASTDETADLLAARPQVQVIRNFFNHFCGAWGQGARAAAPATWTVISNNDILFPQRWLERLIKFAEENHFDVVSPAMCEGKQDYDFPAYAARFMEKMACVKRSGIAKGACFMVHRRVFDKIGFFDEDPKLGGYQDDEFFRRCRRNGFRLAIAGCSFLHHFGSISQKAVKTSMNQPKISLGNRDYYRQKYGLTWFKRHRERFLENLKSAKWRMSERMLYGCTLISYRDEGNFVWR
jgi:N-acetylglucosaminyl-diphospho-decaprenol L-rhamnosyltransferase